MLSDDVFGGNSELKQTKTNAIPTTRAFLIKHLIKKKQNKTQKYCYGLKNLYKQIKLLEGGPFKKERFL